MEKSKKVRAMSGAVLRTTIIMAMLTAMTVVLERFPGLSIKTPGWKICFGFVPPMIAAALLGPLEAGIVYGLADLIGALLFPFGPYHPGFTAVAFAMGFMLGIFLYERPFALFGSKRGWKKIRVFPNMVLPVLINSLLLGLVVNTVWVSQLYGSRTYGGWFMYRLAEYAIMVPAQLVLVPGVLKLCEILKKTGIMRRIWEENAKEKRQGSKLESISRGVSILGLERITELLHLMGDPQDGLRIIHITGTNGKGSVSAMLSSILMHSGYYVGAFNSPALTGSADSFRIDTDSLNEKMLAELDEVYASIAPLTEKMQEKPTEFEVLTAAGFELFKRENCGVCLIECGLGGDGDATNVIKSPLLSIITNVCLDHTDRLGKTVREIASHKAGIIKKGRPAVFGGTDADALEVIKSRAEAMGSELVTADSSRLRVIRETLGGTEAVDAHFGKVRLNLLGEYQPGNAATVLTAVETLRKEGLEIPDSAVRMGLGDAEWPARFEILRRKPYVIFDGSHNPDGVALAAKSIKTLFKNKKAVLLMGVMADKDYGKYPELLREVTAKVFTVTPRNPRSLPAEKLAETFGSAGFIAKPCSSMENAVRAAYAYADRRGLPLVALGTLYMYREFTECLKGIES